MQVEEKEFKRVILEIYDCLAHGSMTPQFLKTVGQYRHDVELMDDLKRERGN